MKKEDIKKLIDKGSITKCGVANKLESVDKQDALRNYVTHTGVQDQISEDSEPVAEPVVKKSSKKSK